MKRKILYLCLFLLGFFLNEVHAGIISGYVKDSTTQNPIANQYVTLLGDSLNSYFDSTFTDSNGVYTFSNVPAIPQFSHYYVTVWNCNQTAITHQIDSLNAVSNFFICHNIPCQASFLNYCDSLTYMQFYFLNTSTGSPTSFLWNFGDNTTSTLQNPTHTYNSVGYFMVSLTISGSNCSSTIYDTIYAGNPCQANFSSQINLSNPLQVTFTNVSTSNLTNFLWSFGDNTTSSLQNPVHTYSQAGTFSVNLYAYNTFCSSSITYSVTVSNPCQASFYSVPDSLNPALIHFINTSIGNPTSFLWNFGDGTSSSLQNPTHSYTSSGFFLVSLTIGGNNCQSTAYDTIQITLSNPCNAVFTKIVDSINPANIHFFDQSTGNPTSWIWNFGDGSSSSLQNPSHTYSQSGTYITSLYITTPNCFDSVSQTISIVSNSGSLVLYVFADSNLINSGNVLLYKYDSINQTITIKDSVAPILYQGVYIFNFPSVPIGNYKILAKLPNQSPIASTYYNTWYGNTFNWQTADVLNIHSASNYALISLVKNTVIIPSGNGIISGNISTFTGSGNIPESGVDIFLLKNDSSIISKTKSNSFGVFMFSNLPFGNYIVYPEIAGIKTIPFHLSLSSSNPNKEGISLVIQSNTISIGLDEEMEEKMVLNIYPNPTTDFINVNLENNFSSVGSIQILDATGRLIFEDEIDFVSNENYKINISNYTEGVYFLIFTSEKNTITKKIIKI